MCRSVDTLSRNGEFGGWECAQNGPKSFRTCAVVQIRRCHCKELFERVLDKRFTCQIRLK